MPRSSKCRIAVKAIWDTRWPYIASVSAVTVSTSHSGCLPLRNAHGRVAWTCSRPGWRDSLCISIPRATTYKPSCGIAGLDQPDVLMDDPMLLRTQVFRWQSGKAVPDCRSIKDSISTGKMLTPDSPVCSPGKRTCRPWISLPGRHARIALLIHCSDWFAPASIAWPIRVHPPLQPHQSRRHQTQDVEVAQEATRAPTTRAAPRVLCRNSGYENMNGIALKRQTLPHKLASESVDFSLSHGPPPTRTRNPVVSGSFQSTHPCVCHPSSPPGDTSK